MKTGVALKITRTLFILRLLSLIISFRLAVEDEKVHIYHTLENSREYHKEEPQFLEIDPESAIAVETLIHLYPAYIPIESLPMKDEGEKVCCC